MTESPTRDRGMGRRALLRKALLTGAGAVVASAAAVSLADPALASTNQGNWSYCGYCKGLFWGTNSFVSGGACPGRNGSAHSIGTRNYNLDFGLANVAGIRQLGWAYCGNCRGLYWGAERASSSCAVDFSVGLVVPHDFGNSIQYDMYYNLSTEPNLQVGWDFCANCKGLYWGNGISSTGICPANPLSKSQPHFPGSSRVYAMQYTGS
jgi:hypothetical protein